jgi:hypothetical protein
MHLTEKVTHGRRKVHNRSFVICVLHQIVLGIQIRDDGRDMKYPGTMGGICSTQGRWAGYEVPREKIRKAYNI